MASTVADDIASITAADAALAAAQTGLAAAQTTLAAAQAADTAADAQLSLDLQTTGPVFDINADGSASFYAYSPTAPGFTITKAAPASSLPTTTPPTPVVPTPTPTTPT